MRSKLTIKNFDAPITSERHAGLRETAWMGGIYTEGPYLLGRLQGRNLFWLTTEDFLIELAKHFAEFFPARSVTVLTTDGHLLVSPILRWQCRHITDITTHGPWREEKAIHDLAERPELSNEELAEICSTTSKQIARMTDIKYFRSLYKGQHF